MTHHSIRGALALCAVLAITVPLAGCKKPGDQGIGGSATPAGTDTAASGAATSSATGGTQGSGSTNDTSSAPTSGGGRSAAEGANPSGVQPIPAVPSASAATSGNVATTPASSGAFAPESDPTRRRNAGEAAQAGAQARGASGASRP